MPEVWHLDATLTRPGQVRRITGDVLVTDEGEPPPPPPPAVTLAVVPESVEQGQSAELSWGVAGEHTALVLSDGLAEEDVFGTAGKTVAPQGTTTYTLTATGPGGSGSDGVTLTVTAPPPPPPPPPPAAGVVWDVESDAPVTMLVGDDPGEHGLHVEHPHPPRFFPPVSLTAVQDGRAGDPATWGGRLPVAGDVVRVPARLVLAPGSRLTGSLYVNAGGTLDADNSADPDALVEVVTPDLPLDATLDPEQWGNAFLNLGTAALRGYDRGPSWSRAAAGLLAGQTVLTLLEPVPRWRVGDRVVANDSRQLPDPGAYVPGERDEVVTLASVSPDGLTVTLSAPLQYDHPAHADGLLFPALVNVTCNVVFRSANPAGNRGHVALCHDHTTLVRGSVGFFDLGRTTLDRHGPANRVGRYAFHVHHGRDGGLDAEGLVVRDTPAAPSTFRGGVVIHGSSGNRVVNGVVYNKGGACFVFEGGGEADNVVLGNFWGKCRGFTMAGDGPDTRGHGTDLWFEGSAFWARCFGNEVSGNYVTNAPRGYFFFPTTNDGNVNLQLRSVPLTRFAGNEAFGMLVTCLEPWDLGTMGNTPIAGVSPSLIDGFRCGNFYGRGFNNYRTNKLTMRGFVVRNRGATGWYGGDYVAEDFVLEAADVRGCTHGFIPSVHGNLQTVRGSHFASAASDVRVDVRWEVNAPINTRPVEVRVEDVTHGGPGLKVEMSPLPRGRSNLLVSTRVFVVAHDGAAGDDFRLYWAEQRADRVLPASTPDLAASPAPGLTNAQLLAAWSWRFLAAAPYAPEYRNQAASGDFLPVCWAGEVAPEGAVTRPGILGLAG